MNVHIAADVIRSIARHTNYAVGKLSPGQSATVEESASDTWLKRLIQWHWFAGDIEPGPEIWAAAHVVDAEANGDQIFLRLSDAAVLYWSHHEPESMHVAYDSVDYLLVAIRNHAYVPSDSYSAREYRAMFQGR